MTSQAMRPSGSQREHAVKGRGYGLVVFAAALVIMVGFMNLIYGISAIANSHVFTAHAHYVFGDLRTWGWITLVISVLQIVAAVGVMVGNQLARWFAVAVIVLNVIDQMFFIPAYPFWSLSIIAICVVALWGLCAYGSRENVDAAGAWKPED